MRRHRIVGAIIGPRHRRPRPATTETAAACECDALRRSLVPSGCPRHHPNLYADYLARHRR